ncbi:melanoma antigen preferentially expressed in tumors-like [Acomys russatus]|uniref:melanoma antigen preferentially expressed in tumors-like n=1 Tax=Acomys russatus TaxID=60746 RepID=UPI0021E1F8A7|nr:melanoma antigen preferentially expressed in tumors-like [Acomys russatus]
MDFNEPPTLFDTAIQCLLHHEPLAIQALQEIPGELFVPLFTAAFKGRHEKILSAMVKSWPFFCLHVGPLSMQEAQHKLWKVMVESLQLFPAENPAFRSPKLRILDLTQHPGCKTKCPVITTTCTPCLRCCAYSERSLMKVESQCSSSSSEPEGQSPKTTMELLVSLSLDSAFRENEFFALLLSKVEQSLGSLHLCCRDLRIKNLSECRWALSHLDLKCVSHLAVVKASLTNVVSLLKHAVNLDSLSLSKITCRSFKGRTFRNFLCQLRGMDHLKELSLSSFCLTDHLEHVLRVLSADLDFLQLPFCELSYSDFKFLSQCPQVNHLKLLDISNNSMYWDDCVPFYCLLENLCGTLQHLAINHCLLTDATLSILAPALSRCSQLRLFSFSSNPITMPMLRRILEYLTSMTQLKYVIYPIPVHCYGRWQDRGSFDPQKLGAVNAQLKIMLQEAKRDDMTWMTYTG